MTDNKFYASGELEYLKSLKKNYEILKEEIENDNKISNKEKKIKLKKIREIYDTNKRDLPHKLF